MKCNDYSEKKYIVGEIPTLEVLNSCLQDEEIVYSLINILKKRVQKGCGIDVSKLAPKGAKVHNAAKETTGAVSFMDFFSYITGLIGQEGRRGKPQCASKPRELIHMRCISL